MGDWCATGPDDPQPTNPPRGAPAHETRIDRLRSRLSYANVAATLALFVALGGTSYAAITLPRDSVGHKQIRKNAVRSSEIRAKTIRLNDLATKTRTALRGQTGPQGPAGPPAIREFAHVSSGGGLSGTADTITHDGGTNSYSIRFRRDEARARTPRRSLPFRPDLSLKSRPRDVSRWRVVAASWSW